MSSYTNTMAAGYQVPVSTSANVNTNSGQLNAAGQSYYAGNGQQTVAQTNPQTGAIIPTPQPGPAPTPNQNTQIPQPGNPSVDYNAIYQPALDALNAAINSANSNEAGQEQSILGQQTSAAGDLGTALSGQMNQIGQAKTTQQTGTQNAIQQAKQAYSEIGQGIQARYGSSTGTGAFATELAGRTTATNMAQFQTNLTNALGGLDQAAQQVQQVHDQNIKDLQTQTEVAIQQAKATLSTNITSIQNNIGQVQSAKAAQIANAVIDYQKSVDAVNQMNAQYAQQLETQQQAIQGQIATARAAGTAYLSTGTTNANTALANSQNLAASNTNPLTAATNQPVAAAPVTYYSPTQKTTATIQ
jgi:hypothetical protein